MERNWFIRAAPSFTFSHIRIKKETLCRTTLTQHYADLIVSNKTVECVYSYWERRKTHLTVILETGDLVEWVSKCSDRRQQQQHSALHILLILTTTVSHTQTHTRSSQNCWVAVFKATREKVSVASSKPPAADTHQLIPRQLLNKPSTQTDLSLGHFLLLRSGVETIYVVSSFR